MRLAQGRPEVVFLRNFDIECVSDQVRTDLDGKIWVVVDMLVEQSSPRRQVEREGVNPPRDFITRRRVGVIHAAGSSSVMTELAEVAAEQVRARCARALGAPHALASTHGSAAGSPGASRSRAPHIYGLEGRRHHIRTGPGSPFGSWTTRKDARDSRGSVLSIEGGNSAE